MKNLEIHLDDRVTNVQLLGKEGSDLKIAVDDKIYEVDILQVEHGVYSVLLEGRSYNVELIESGGPKIYYVNTFQHSFNVEVVDAESKYQKSRKKNDSMEESVISSPMPGKVVKIPVKIGDHVQAGDTVIIVSAMKMESEYKVKNDRIIRDIKVQEGETVSAHQPLIVIE
jgi:biotin carboxyl carrier protein